jgi:hypothetical protein
VDKHGIAKVIEMALLAIDPNGRRPLHLSLDIDGIDPHFAPGTGTCARGGARDGIQVWDPSVGSEWDGIQVWAPSGP